MKRSLFVLIALVSTAFVTGCYYDTLEELYPPVVKPNPPSGNTGGCDTAGTVGYDTKVKPILDKHCAGCHGVSGGVTLSDFAGAKAAGVTGKLISSLVHDGNASPMPQGGNKLSPCEIETVRKWINSNYPN